MFDERKTFPLNSITCAWIICHDVRSLYETLKIFVHYY